MGWGGGWKVPNPFSWWEGQCCFCRSGEALVSCSSHAQELCSLWSLNWKSGPKDQRSHRALLGSDSLVQGSAVAGWNCSFSFPEEEGGYGKSVGHVWNRGFSWAPLELNLGKETNVWNEWRWWLGFGCIPVIPAWQQTASTPTNSTSTVSLGTASMCAKPLAKQNPTAWTTSTPTIIWWMCETSLLTTPCSVSVQTR